MEQWLEKQGFKVVKSGGEVIIEGNVFNAWEPHGGARYWGGWAANPGVGLEVIAKDAKGNVVAEIRHKAKGSTVRDAVENGLEDVRQGARGKGQAEGLPVFRRERDKAISLKRIWISPVRAPRGGLASCFSSRRGNVIREDSGEDTRSTRLPVLDFPLGATTFLNPRRPSPSPRRG